ncbi:MAG: glycoside hydrolase family 28 protein [Halobacteriaceae archaeon]
MARFDVTEHGAAGDGETADTAAVQSAIDACAAAGGGTVVVPAGEYVCAPLFLKSDVEVHLEAGATLLGSQDVDAYPVIPGRHEGLERDVHASLITALDRENVAVTGEGTIDCRGRPWWVLHWHYYLLRKERGLSREEHFPSPHEADLDHPRPRAINLINCANVRLADVTIRNSPSWTVHPVYCENVTMDGLTVENPEFSPNTDGLNPDSCSNVRIANCHVDVGDDCVTIKSGYDEDGRRVGEACENVTVTNCTMRRGHGGVVIGSEMSGDVRNVTVSNCVFDGTDRGLRIKTERGRGGVVENVRATNLVMDDVVDHAFVFTMRYGGGDAEYQPVDEGTPTIRNVHYSDITVTGARTIANFDGLPERPIDDVSLSDVHADAREAGIDASYVTGLLLDNVVADVAGDAPALDASNVETLEVDRLRDPSPDPDVPVLRFRDVDGALVTSCTAVAGTGTFLELVGDGNRDVVLQGNLLAKAERERVAVEEAGRNGD